MIKRFHEAPISVFDKVQAVTDGDYFLVHLYETHPDYLQKFYQAREQGRETILDNSIFELGEAFDMKKFANWVERTQPTWYIVPDVLESSYGTLYNLRKWNDTYADRFVDSKKIVVVQGKTYDEIVRCYSEIATTGDADMIAISFDYSYYEDSVPNPNKYMSWMLGRVKLLGDLAADGVIDEKKPHHLLGTSLYWEGLFYKDYKWIYSIDTSNPVVFATNNLSYKEGLPVDKPTQKLFTLMDVPKEDINLTLVLENIELFRQTWN